MKKGLHPELHEVIAHCACGNQFKTRSTATELKVTLCSACHPYFTGAQKLVDTAGRIEKFEKRYKKGAEVAQKAAAAHASAEQAAKAKSAPAPKAKAAPAAPKAKAPKGKKETKES